MKNRLAEIITRARKALAVTDKIVIDEKVEILNEEKGTYISVGGEFDAIILLAEDILKDPSLHEPLIDNMDHADRHNIAGGMNRPDRASEYEHNKTEED